MRVGYARVSTRDQNLDAQTDALAAAGCERVFVDKASGTLERRPELDKVLFLVRPGDQLVITKLDRLFRSLKHLMTVAADLRSREVDLVVLDSGIDTSTPGGRALFHVMGAFAEFEHDLMLERTYAGLAAARARGRTGGRKSKISTRQAAGIRAMYDEKGDDGRRAHTVAEIAKEYKVSRATIYRVLEKETS